MQEWSKRQVFVWTIAIIIIAGTTWFAYSTKSKPEQKKTQTVGKIKNFYETKIKDWTHIKVIFKNNSKVIWVTIHKSQLNQVKQKFYDTYCYPRENKKALLMEKMNLGPLILKSFPNSDIINLRIDANENKLSTVFCYENRRLIF